MWLRSSESIRPFSTKSPDAFGAHATTSCSLFFTDLQGGNGVGVYGERVEQSSSSVYSKLAGLKETMGTAEGRRAVLGQGLRDLDIAERRRHGKKKIFTEPVSHLTGHLILHLSFDSSIFGSVFGSSGVSQRSGDYM